MKRRYIEKRFNTSSLIMINHACDIIDEYKQQGFDLTVRQLYYQFVSRDLIENKQSAYNKLSRTISNARLAGLIDWESIVDRTRFLRSVSTWNTPRDIVETCADQYKEDLWSDQPYYLEVWVEKDALIGVLEPICNKFRIPFIACRGYMSQSEQWEASIRFRREAMTNKHCVLLHLGDHDPSGLDMTRDNNGRLELFGANVCVERLALNMDQIEEYEPPPNPAKFSDPRADEYIEQYGYSSWELDALEPSIINNLIEDSFYKFVDHEQWDISLAEEERNKQQLYNLIDYLED